MNASPRVSARGNDLSWNCPPRRAYRKVIHSITARFAEEIAGWSAQLIAPALNPFAQLRPRDPVNLSLARNLEDGLSRRDGRRGGTILLRGMQKKMRRLVCTRRQHVETVSSSIGIENGDGCPLAHIQKYRPTANKRRKYCARVSSADSDHSRRTSAAFLSSRRATNRECRR
jgi:hypothetical protein